MFGRSNRRTAQGPAYDLRLMINHDPPSGSEYAFDDDMVITTSQSGLAGLVPLWNIAAVQPPHGFDYITNLIGLGGTPSPRAVPQPLINQPQYAAQYISENI